MKEVEIIGLLAGQGLALFLDNGRLRCRGQMEAYTPELRQLVAEHRESLADHLTRAERVLTDLTRLAAALASEPWVTPAHQAILADWKTAAECVAREHPDRDLGELLEDLQAWAERCRRDSKAPAVQPGQQ